jgi:exopolysaccharide biosynthesis polyprenyl glycosylphosphotransferase
VSEQAASVATPLQSVPWLAEAPVERRSGLRRDTNWTLARAASDASLLTIGAIVASLGHADALGAGWHAFAVLASLAALAAAGAYLPRLRLELTGELVRVATATAAAMVAAGAAAVIVSGRTGAGDAAVVHWLVASSLVAGGRVALFTAQRTLRARDGHSRRTLIVGAGFVGHTTAKRLLDEPQLGMCPVGFLDKEPLMDEAERTLRGLPELPVLGASWDIERVVAEHAIDDVVVAFSTAPHGVLLEIVRRCWRLGVNVLVVPRLYEVEGRRAGVDHLGGLPLISVRAADADGWQFSLKYAMDRVLAGVALLLLAPLLAAISLAILLSTGRPVLFRQQRVGRDGHVFEILKFRTMRGAPERDGEANAHWASLVLAGTPVDAPAEPRPSDDRRTRLGTLLRMLSLDELPQLWNVVMGDMSLVGPRPEMPHYVERFEDVIYRYPERHRVKSGLTGWAQVHGLRGNTSLSDRIEWDNFYIENWSPWLDLKILCLTLPAVLGRRGAT